MDGSQVAYETVQNGFTVIGVVSASGLGARTITTPGSNAMEPAWSPAAIYRRAVPPVSAVKPASAVTPILATPAPSTPTPTIKSAASRSTAILTLDNRSQRTACYVYLAHEGDLHWGVDALGPQGIVGAGQTAALTNLAPGQADVKVEDCDHNVLSYTRGLPLAAGQTQVVTIPLRGDFLDVSVTLCDGKTIEFFGEVVGSGITALNISGPRNMEQGR